MDRLRLGLVLLALAPLAWIVGILVDGATAYLPSVALQLAGLALAAWALPSQRRWPAAAGFAAAALGILWFYGGDLFAGLAPLAGALFLAGCLVAAAGAVRDAHRVLAVGLLAVALGGALWVYADGVNAGWIWQPGNALATGGAALAGVAAWREG